MYHGSPSRATGNRVITRRRVVLALGAGVLGRLAAFAQEPGKVRRIGFLSPQSLLISADKVIE